MSFDPSSFYPMSFDPGSFDSKSFDPMSVNPIFVILSNPGAQLGGGGKACFAI